ncbi:MAG TPA: secondary thiamine-phosphate synthase enzyme YjbQ [Tepidisphaeraceae bacterium]|jgi:secondary thiamine-phosphate synthase enzyme|nr:secondary thiamine-phosphate synthase enzyme YjbQ [Tepidisphaeraceae bacterium]
MNRFNLHLETDGNNAIVNLNPHLVEKLRDIKGAGVLCLFVVGSTAALTTLEYEAGLIKHDMPGALQRIVPDDIRYEHEATWNDDNGHSHIRAALMGPSLMLPFENGLLLTGEYQQAVLIDFDTRPRRRTVIVTVLT